ncbi:MAG TPA: hypothetical protein VF532_03390, partial [Candidatus Angelobacter sp.]
KELRDFLLSSQRAFRRLLLGLHQDSGNIIDVFAQWREWRAKNGIDFTDGNRTSYYGQGGFPADFLKFVRLHYIPAATKAPLAMTALVEYEAALLSGDQRPHEPAGASRDQAPSGDRIIANDDEAITPDSRPQLFPGVNVIGLPADYQEIVRRLKQRSPLYDLPSQPVKIAVRKAPSGPAEARQLSPLSAELLDLCEDGLTVAEIAAEFMLRQIEISGVPAEKLCMAGIQILRQQRLIALA